jgi:hypothetical protein
MVMGWIDITATVSTQNLDAVQALYRQAPEMTDRAVRRDLVPFARHYVDRNLRREPGTPVRPLRWAPSRHPEDRDKPPNTRWGYYSRQKAAYFFTDGFGAGIPYHRTHHLVRGWHVTADYANGFGGIRVHHDSEVSLFVVGKWQQRYHYDTGWPQAASELQILSLQLDERLEQIVFWVGEDINRGQNHDAA